MASQNESVRRLVGIERPAPIAEENLLTSVLSTRSRLGSGANSEPDAEAGIDASEADGDRCSLCEAKLGKRRLNPRHHCRLCNRCVCGACSPTSVPIYGQAGLHRACNACLSGLGDTADVSGRVSRLHRKLQSLTGKDSERQAKFPSEALELCEQSVGVLEQELDEGKLAKARSDRLYAETRSAEVSCRQLAWRLRCVGGETGRPTADLPQPASLGQAVALCETATKALEDAQRKRRFSWGRGDSAEGQQRWSSDARVPLRSGDTQAYSIFTPRPSLGGRSVGTDEALASSIGGPLSEAVSESGTPREGSPTALRPESTARCLGCSRFRLSKPGKWIAGTTSCLAVIACLAVAVCFWLVPLYAQRTMDGTSIMLLSAAISQPGNDSVLLMAQTSMSSSCIISSHVHGFNATLGVGGRNFGWAIFPDIEMSADGRTFVTLNSTLHITESKLFAEAMAPLLQGKAIRWSITGKPKVTAAGLSMGLVLRQSLELPATALEEVTGADVDIVDGSATELHATADTVFFSSSLLEIKALGSTTFALHPVAADGTVEMGMDLGRVVMPDFQVSRGYNRRKASFFLRKSSDTESHLSEFMGRWASGLTQTVAIRGPVDSVSPFLENITVQLVSMAGIAEGMMTSAYISKAHSLRGHEAASGKECPLIGAKDCLRGSVVSAQNVLHHAVELVDASFDVDVPDTLSYKTVMHELFFPREISCNKSTRIARMRTVPGMWSYMDPTRVQDSFAILPPAQMPGQKSLTSFFLSAEPQPGQSDGEQCIAAGIDPMDCCFTTILSAAACFYRRKDLSLIPLVMSGNVTLLVGSFQLEIKVRQEGVPLTYAEEIAEFQVGALRMSCSDFVFD
mmetsp:Transcript_101337/g.180118  ORF Transcript_101337/g.180118 Transcript_101337/m.180118 type:complete len:856 (-) Transcript_101337:50-2617(-)